MIEDLRCQESGSGMAFHRSLAELPNIKGRRSGLHLSSFVLVLLTPYLALRLEYAQKLLLAVIILDIPFQLGTHLFYNEADGISGALAGLSISATSIALIGLYASWLIRTLENRGQRSFKVTGVSFPLLSYLGFVALSMVVARDVRLSCFELFLLVQMFLVFLYAANFVRTRGDVLFVVSTLLTGCLIESALVIALGFFRVPSGVWGPLHVRVDTLAQGGLARVGGTVGSPNEAGAYLSFVLAVAVGLLFSDVLRGYKYLAASVVGLTGVALIFTFSRGAWTSLFVAAPLFYVLLLRRKGASVKTPIAALAILLISCLPFHNAIEARLFADDNGSAESRIPLMKLAFRIITDNPVLGVGSNNFSTVMDSYLTPEFRNGFLYTVHNKYLLVWAELGLGGLLAYLAFLLGVLRRGWVCWKFGDPFLSMLALGLTTATIGNMLHQTVDIFHDRAVTQLLWLVAGLLVAIHNILRTQTVECDPFSYIT